MATVSAAVDAPHLGAGDLVVIVGAGQAAHQAATALREAGFAGRIRMFGEEPHLPYQRPPLSKTFLDGSLEEADLFFDTAEELVAHRIEFESGNPVVSIDVDARTIHAQTGETVVYGALVLATGAQVRRLPGAPDDVLYLRNLADAITLRDRLAESRRLVVIGAGFLGLEAACVAHSLGHQVTVLEAAPTMMARALSTDMAERLSATHTGAGIDLRFAASIVDFVTDEQGRTRGVHLANGEVVEADVVVASIGVTPRVELAESAGIGTANGILVDEHLMTSAPGVYALGDCAAFPLETGRVVRMESVPNATDQADYLAARLTGGELPYRAKPWFWSHQSDQRLQIAGLGFDVDERVVGPASNPDGLNVLLFSNGQLTAVESVNSPRDHMRARRLLFGERRPTLQELAACEWNLQSETLNP